MPESISFIPLLLVLFLAFVVPLLLTRFKRLRLPIVVGEILAGILIGPSGLDWVHGHDPILELLAEFGFVFLMFLSGMEIDFSNLGSLGVQDQSSNNRDSTWGPIRIGLTSFLLTLAISTAISFGLVTLELAQNPWMVALILSTTSLGVILPVLKESGLSTGRYGQTLLISALVADFVTMLLITVLVAAVSHGLTLDILLVGVLFVAFFLVYRLGNLFFNRWKAIRRAMSELSHATAQIKVRAAFTMMLIFVVLSEILGAEIILGAFLAGAIVALLSTPEDADLAAQLETIGFGFFIPIFFIKVGIDFNLRALLSSPENLLLALGLLVAALLVKFIPALIFRKVYSWRETFAAGALLSARLSLIIAASAIGLRLGVISDIMNAEIILVAVITVTIAPPLFLKLIPPQLDDIQRMIVVAGADPLGIQVAQRLQAHNELVLVVDSNETRVERAKQLGLEAKLGRLDCPTPELAAHLDQTKALVSTLSDVDLNYRVCQQARTVFGIDHIIAQVSTPGEISRFEQLGVVTMNAALDRAALLDLLTRNPTMYSLLTRLEDGKKVIEVDVCNPLCSDKTLLDLKLPGDLLVLALNRGGELLVPHGNTRIELGDRLTLVGSCDCVEPARQLFTSRQPCEG